MSENKLNKNHSKDFEYTVFRDDGRDILFNGVIAGFIETSTNQSSDNYSGHSAHTETMAIYTVANGYVCELIENRTNSTHYSGLVTVAPDEIIEFFGYTQNAKSLYREAMLDNVLFETRLFQE